jgi:hypothetical protein
MMTMKSDLVMMNALTSVVVNEPWDVVGSEWLAVRLGIKEELRDREVIWNRREGRR